MARPRTPAPVVSTRIDVKTFATGAYSITRPHALIERMASGMRNRQRVSSHDLYQSMSVLRLHGFKEDFFQRDRQDVDRGRPERAGFVEDRLSPAARDDREHAAHALHAD